MPSGRKPEGDQALSNAERQARYRARQQQPKPPAPARPRKAVDRRSRPRRWRDAVAELLAIQQEYAAWLGTLPDNLQDSPTADALREVVDLDLDSLAAITPPKGFGRD